MVHHEVIQKVILLEVVERIREAGVVHLEAVPRGWRCLLIEPNAAEEVVSVVAA